MSQSAAITGATAADFATAKFSGPTRLIFRRLTLTATRTTALSPNPRRVHWLMINRSTITVGLWFDVEATVNESILLAGNGGFVSMSVDEDGEAVTLPVQLVTGSSGPVIVILEVERQ